MIGIQSISIQNFRGIRESELKDFADVNVFVGRNNSGKTTVLEAISRLATGNEMAILGEQVNSYWQNSRGVELPEGREVVSPKSLAYVCRSSPV
jgi:AAA15 family ATPase/GTPase